MEQKARRPVQDRVFAVRRRRIPDRLQPGLDRHRGDNDGNQLRGLRLDGITRGGMDGFIAVIVRVGRGYHADVADEHEHAREEKGRSQEGSTARGTHQPRRYASAWNVSRTDREVLHTRAARVGTR